MAVPVLPGSPITSIKDLAGHTVTVHVLNNIQAITLNAIAGANGVDPAGIKYRQVMFPQMAATMQKGGVDAIHVNEPFLTDAEVKLGARMVVDGGAAGRDAGRQRPGDEADRHRVRVGLAGAVQHRLRPARRRPGRPGHAARVRLRPARRAGCRDRALAVGVRNL